MEISGWSASAKPSRLPVSKTKNSKLACITWRKCTTRVRYGLWRHLEHFWYVVYWIVPICFCKQVHGFDSCLARCLSSGHVALVKTENRLGWSDNEETTLLLEGSVFIRIYIPSESSKGIFKGWIAETWNSVVTLFYPSLHHHITWIFCVNDFIFIFLVAKSLQHFVVHGV